MPRPSAPCRAVVLTTCPLYLRHPERAFVLLRKRKTFGWILIGVATPLIAAGCALGLASGSVTILAVSSSIIPWKTMPDTKLTSGALSVSLVCWSWSESAVQDQTAIGRLYLTAPACVVLPSSQTLFGDFVVLTNLIIAWKSTTVLTDVILT